MAANLPPDYSSQSAVTAQSSGTPSPPRNYLPRAVILAVLLVPLCLLLGISALVSLFQTLTGPPVMSEIPMGMRALMQFLRLVAVSIGLFMPILAIYHASRANARYTAGDFQGSAQSEKAAANNCRASIIFLIIVLLMMATDVLNYMTR